MSIQTSQAPADSSKFVSGFVALVVVGIWIPLLCTAPQLLGSYLWRKPGFASDLPLAHLVRVSVNTVAVLAFLAISKRTKLLVPERPKRPGVFLLFLPLMAVNVARGPFTDAGAAFVLVSLAGTMLTGFWEEFLFRGLVQERLSVLGPRPSLFLTGVMFALIHVSEGPWAMSIAFGIGLAFCVARDAIGLWPLVFIHGAIDFTSDVFVRRWEWFGLLGIVVVGVYFLASLFVLLARSQKGVQKGVIR